MAWKNLNRPNWFIFSDAQAITVVMLEVISTRVLTVPDRNIQPTVRPKTFRRAHAQQNVSGKQRSEEHDFGRQEQPNADLGIVKPGIRPRFYCVRNFHESAASVLGFDIELTHQSGWFCGVKSAAWPGTLYS